MGSFGDAAAIRVAGIRKIYKYNKTEQMFIKLLKIFALYDTLNLERQ